MKEKKKIDQNQVCNDILYKEVSQELGVSEVLVREIVQVQSEFTKMIIQRGEFEAIRYVYLGKIEANYRKVQHINDRLGKQ